MINLFSDVWVIMSFVMGRLLKISTNSLLGCLFRSSIPGLLLSDFCMIVVLNDSRPWGKVTSTMNSIFNALLAAIPEHMFICLLVIWTLSFEKYLFISFAHFFTTLFCWVSWATYRFWIPYFHGRLVCKYFLPPYQLSPTFVGYLLCGKLACCKPICLLQFSLPEILSSITRHLCLCWYLFSVFL